MANHEATGKKAKHGRELVQRCRAAVLGALEILESKTGKKITEILAQELEANPLKFMELASKFCPKDLQVELNDITDRAEQLSDDELADIAETGRNRVAPTTESTH